MRFRSIHKQKKKVDGRHASYEIITSHISWSRKSLAIPPRTWPPWDDQSISTVVREVADLKLGDPVTSVSASPGRHTGRSQILFWGKQYIYPYIYYTHEPRPHVPASPTSSIFLLTTVHLTTECHTQHPPSHWYDPSSHMTPDRLPSTPSPLPSHLYTKFPSVVMK